MSLITNTNIVIGNTYNLTVHGSTSVKESGLDIHHSTDYIDLGPDLDCLLNPTICQHGLTVQFTIKLNKLVENTYLITSGGQLPDGTGLAVVFRYGKLQFVLSTKTMSWFATCGKDKVKPNAYHTITVSWHMTTGIEVIIDNILVDANKVPVNHATPVSTTTNVYFGKQPASTVSVDYILQSITVWYVNIEILIDRGICKPPAKPTGKYNI